MEGTSLRFAAAARALSMAARDRGLEAPSFRSPPRVAGAERTIRRLRSGSVVAVVIRDRPWPAVLADMIEGVIVANQLTGGLSTRLRTALWEVVDLGQAAAA